MSNAQIQTRRPVYCLPPRPAREMSVRGLAILAAVYVTLFGAAGLHYWLTR